MLEQGLFKTDSNIQIITNSILNDLSVEFVNEFNAKYVSIDNYLPKYNLMIEVMGQYWHTDPRKYLEINYQRQVDRIKHDKIKNSYIKSQYDIDILYLWEEDILANPTMIKQLIQEYINKQGQLENYHSFNYSFDNFLSINENLIVPYMEYSIECLRPLINIEPSNQKTRKDADKWIELTCGGCDEKFEKLIAHVKIPDHTCSRECSHKQRKLKRENLIAVN
jgi:hypothetical protein